MDTTPLLHFCSYIYFLYMYKNVHHTLETLSQTTAMPWPPDHSSHLRVLFDLYIIYFATKSFNSSFSSHRTKTNVYSEYLLIF